jgi:hypothetical protein
VILFPQCLSPDLSEEWRCPPQTVFTGSLRNLRPNIGVPLRLAVYAVSAQHTQDGPDRKGTWVGRWAVVWTEYRHRHDQVRRYYYHHSRLYADISFRSLVQSFPDSTLAISVAVDGQIFQMDVHPASY